MLRLHTRPEDLPPRPESGGRVLPWRAPETGNGPAIDAVLAEIRPRIQSAEQEWAEAPTLLGELLRHTLARRELLVRNSRRFQSLALCGLLLARSHQESAVTPWQGERLAALALALADSLDADWYGDWALADARARCWMQIGSARRLAADLPGAERAFRAAEAHLSQGTGDWKERARLAALRTRLGQVRSR
jgi:hypothetical protein